MQSIHSWNGLSWTTDFSRPPSKYIDLYVQAYKCFRSVVPHPFITTSLVVNFQVTMFDNDRNNAAREEDGPGGDNDVVLAKQIMTTQQNLLTRTGHLLCSLFYYCCCGAISEDGTEKPQ